MVCGRAGGGKREGRRERGEGARKREAAKGGGEEKGGRERKGEERGKGREARKKEERRTKSSRETILQLSADPLAQISARKTKRSMSRGRCVVVCVFDLFGGSREISHGPAFPCCCLLSLSLRVPPSGIKTNGRFSEEKRACLVKKR